jgi:hypothetical protein
MRDRYTDNTPWIHKRYPFNVLFGPKARTPQEISPELFINTSVPQGFNFAGEYVPPQAVLPAQLPANLPALTPRDASVPAQAPFQVPTAGMAALYGAGLGGLTGAGLGLLINGDAAGAIGGGLLGAEVGGVAAPFLSPYLVAKLNELYGLNGG